MIKEELKKRMLYGDFNILSKMLRVPQSTLRARFSRNDIETLYAIKELLDNRDEFIKAYRKKNK
jgi:hypothetical protein